MAEIKNISLKHAESGEVYLRNAVVLAYFVDQPTHEISEQVSAMLDHYLAVIPKDALKWAIPNASAEEWRPMDGKTVANCKKLLAPAGSKARDLTSFRLSDSEGEAPSFEFYFVGKPKGRKYQQASSLIQLVFPIEMVEAKRVAGFVDTVTGLSQMVDFAYGYCSPVLLYSELRLVNAYMEIRGLAIRHPGYDVQENMLAAWTLGMQVRGARWITLLGPDLLAQVGGVKSLKRTLKDAVSVQEIESSVMIRAGEQPEIGDVNRQLDTPLLRQVAKVLEPVTHFGERGLVFTKLEEDDVFLNRWERRFLD